MRFHHAPTLPAPRAESRGDFLVPPRFALAAARRDSEAATCLPNSSRSNPEPLRNLVIGNFAEERNDSVESGDVPLALDDSSSPLAPHHRYPALLSGTSYHHQSDAELPRQVAVGHGADQVFPCPRLDWVPVRPNT